MKRMLLLLISALLLSRAFSASCSIPIAGVKQEDSTYTGVLANLTVEIAPGNGRVFVDTMPLTQVDTQASARMAKEAICELLNADCRNYDFFYIIRSENPLVGGPSAGAAMASCTLSLLTGIPLYNDTVITGTINPDASIGPVGSIFEKMSSLKGKGYKYFLAPEDSEIETTLINNTLTEVNLSKYAQEELKIQFVTIGDIIEAFKYMAGYSIQLKNVSSADVASKEYEEVMKEMSCELVNKAQETYDLVKNSDFAELLNNSFSLLNQSKSYFNQGNYYSSASYAVRSLIFSTYVKYLLNYSEGDSSYVLDVINSLNNSISEYNSALLSNLTIDHIYDIESLAITIDRVKEAESLLNQAESLYDLGLLTNALYTAAFADVRLLTAKQWSSLIDYFNGNESIKFDINSIKPLVIERLEQARNSIAYARTIMTDENLLSSEEHLTNAVKAFNKGSYIYALFEALKARAEANLAMEIRGVSNISTKISSKIKSAARAIKRAEERGLLPFLSISFLEYSSTFTDDPLQELIFLSYSKEFAGISSSINDYVKYGELSVSDGYTVIPFARPNTHEDPLYQIILIVIGFIFGLIVTLIRFES